MSFKKDIPNYLTYFRIAVIPAMIIIYLWGHYFLKEGLPYYISAALFAIASITDWLDGYMARMWRVESNIGRFLDPIADKLLVATALLLLVSTHRADLLPAIAIVCREILVSGLREFLACIHVSVPVSRLAKWKTGLQMGAIFLLLLGSDGPVWLYADTVGNICLWLAALFTLVTGYAYLKTGIRHMA